MISIGALAFLNPWLLTALVALPVLWWLLRAIPPKPRLQAFAGVRLLLGLEDEERQADKTPWWLLLLRILAVAAVIIGFSQPVLNPSAWLRAASGPVLVLMDSGWASAPDWEERRTAALGVLEEAAEAGRDVVLWRAAQAERSAPSSAAALSPLLRGADPAPWGPDHAAVLEALDAGEIETPSEILWFHTDVADGPATADLAVRLAALAPLHMVGPARGVRAVAPPSLKDGALAVDVLHTGRAEGPVRVLALAADADGNERRVAVAEGVLTADQTRAEVVFDLPPEALGKVTRVALADAPSAGATAIADGSIRRLQVGLVGAETTSGAESLTSPTYYIEKAVAPFAVLRPGTLDDHIEKLPAAIILADRGEIAATEADALIPWIEEGGLLIRFAGARLAAAIGEDGIRAGGARMDDDPLLPVRLRRGGRVLGGALAWSTPRSLGPFDPDGPFRDLVPPDEVDVRTQVLAEPSPELAGRVWAQLDDGTPLVTARRLGTGHVVLFHVSADAEWSSLPLSGLFVEMMSRLLALAPGRGATLPDADALAGTLWRPEMTLDSRGRPVAATGTQTPVAGERLLGPVGADLPPGIYRRADVSGDDARGAERAVRNVMAPDEDLVPFPAPPTGATVETLGGAEQQRYGPWFLAAAILLALADVIGTLIVSGRLVLPVRSAAMVLAGVLTFAGSQAEAQGSDPVSDDAAVLATAETTLGFVRTGIERIDRVSERGLVGLGDALTQRTAVEPGPPVGVDAETDALAFYPVLYMPLTADALPSRQALARLSDYLDRGGMIIMDTQAGGSGAGAASPADMRIIAQALQLPPLAPVDQDHVLTRSFYLLSSFPGRWRGGQVWAEAPPASAPDGAPEATNIPQFDRVDDNVSPVIVGSADWAAAWAVDERGFPLYPVGRSGDRQREMAMRFGVNAVMYALTGNYKSDQVHAPAVLQRLGQ